jgi:hypothetical protein
VKSSLLAGALLASTFVGCGGGVDLCDQRVAGQVRTYLRTIDIAAVNPAGKKGGVHNEVTTRETAAEVLRGGDTTLDVSFERILFRIFGEGPDPMVTMDTGAAPSALETVAVPSTQEEKLAHRVAPFRHVIGGVASVEVKKTRLVFGVTRAEELGKRVLDKLPPGDDRREAYEQYAWQNWVANLLKPAIVVQAEGMTVGKDIHFQDMRTLPETALTGGYMYYVGTCRLAKVEAGIARLELEAEVFLDPPKGMPPWPRGVAERRNFLRLSKGVCRAWAKVEVETGILLEDEHVTDLDLTFIKPDGKGEVAIPQKVTLRSKLVR